MNLTNPNLPWPNITHKFKKMAKRGQLIRVTTCDGGVELHQAFDTGATWEQKPEP